MKLVLITDQHFGVRGDNKIVLDYFEKFYRDIFFPYLDKHGIKKVYDLGDTFDRRKQVNFLTLHRARNMYFEEIKKRNIELTCLVGNHNTYYRDTNDLNSLRLLLEGYDIKILENPEEVTEGSLKMLLLPWITPENQKQTFEMIASSKATHVFGHLEIIGMLMQKGMRAEHGLERGLFSNYEYIGSGHFHHRSKEGAIEYLGSPYEMTWNDYGNQKGFHVLDTETKKLEFVPNPYKLFIQVEYDDENKTTIEDFELPDTKDSIVKLKVIQKDNHTLFESVLNTIALQQPFSLNIIDNRSYELEEIEFEGNVEDTDKILSSYIDNIDSKDLDKNVVKDFIKQLHQEALTISI